MKRPCLTPRCPNYAVYRGRCTSCSRDNEKAINRAGSNVYSRKKWAITRRRKLALNPLCEHPDCEKLAEHVHHVQDLADGGDPWAMSNLQSVCASHHSQETRRRQMA